MDTVYVYKYCIEYFDECDNKMRIERGIAFGSTFSEVVRRLEAYYDEKNIESIRELAGFDVGGEYVMSERAFEDLGYRLSIRKHD